MKRYKFHWLFCLLVISVIFAAVHKVGDISLEANVYDPLAYKAVDQAWATALLAEKEGQMKANFPNKVDVANSLETFTTVYDKDKKVVGSSGELDGQTPELPAEFLDGTAPYVQNYFTWEPKEGTNLAGVTVAVGDDGYVLVGRSMREDDRHFDRLAKTTFIGWGVSVVLMTLGFAVVSRQKK